MRQKYEAAVYGIVTHHLTTAPKGRRDAHSVALSIAREVTQNVIAPLLPDEPEPEAAEAVEVAEEAPAVEEPEVPAEEEDPEQS